MFYKKICLLFMLNFQQTLKTKKNYLKKKKKKAFMFHKKYCL